MKVKELIEKIKQDHRYVHVHIYAPAEGYENRYYKLDAAAEVILDNKEVLGYEFIDKKEYMSELNIIIDRPVDHMKVTIIAHFVDGGQYELTNSIGLSLELHEFYDFWPAHMDYRTGEPWKDDEQLAIDESEGSSNSQ